MSSRAHHLLLPLLLASLASVTPAAAFREVGIDDQRLSETGPAMNPNYDATSPAIAWNADEQRWVACWSADETLDEHEIYCDVLTAAGGVLLDDALVSFHGPSGTQFAALAPDVTYNSVRDEYLVCWHGDTTDGGTVDDEFEIYCRRFDANMTPIGSRIRVSTQGGTGDASEDAFNVAVAFNFQDDNYLICWRGDVIAASVGADDEFEVYCRLMDGDGTFAASAFKTSAMGPNEDPAFDAGAPTVVYGSTLLTSHEYLVCWSGDDDDDGMVEGEEEIFCRRISGVDGATLGSQVRMSHQGADGSPTWDALNASVAFDPFRSRYLVCWNGDTNAAGGVDGEQETWCGEWNRSLAPTHAATRASFAGADGIATSLNWAPRAAWNGTLGWNVCYVHDQAPVREVVCQMLTPDLATLGPRPGFVSSISAGAGGYSAPQGQPAVGRNSQNGEWLVVWAADTEDAGLADAEFEIFGQRVDPGIFGDGFESQTTAAWSSVTP